MLFGNPDWKANYDHAGPVDFLLIATRKKHAICGGLMPSADVSGRRFPFIAATLFEVENPLAFLPLSPLLLERHQGHQRALLHHAARTYDATEALARLADIAFEKELVSDVEQTYRNFLLDTSVAKLADALSLEDGHTALRRMILALGFLLQPLLAKHATVPQNGILLPLPRDPLQVARVKALWLDLASVFLAQATLDLSIFSCMHGGMPKLLVTFNGTTPSTFRALFDEQAAQQQLIDVACSSWVDDYLHQDPVLFKLANYLDHDSLTLRQMKETFHQGFSG